MHELVAQSKPSAHQWPGLLLSRLSPPRDQGKSVTVILVSSRPLTLQSFQASNVRTGPATLLLIADR